ncbi:MAG: ATP-dependent DNA helicase RecG [Sulfurimonadaceae bacterium]|nr:ATP-dependent DNA helicase RecG [Sulfurimonadaceae bacterium]
MSAAAIEKADREKFKRLHVESLTGLAVLAPAAFEDRRLQPTLQPHMNQTVDATVEAVSRTPQTLKVTLFVHNFGHKIDAVLFRPKPYMARQFVIGERNYYYGRIECGGGRCQMPHPQKVTEVGGLIPKYKTELRTDVMARLVKRHLNEAALLAEGLPSWVVTMLLQVHFPQQQPLVRPGSGYSEDAMRALKFAELYDYMRRLQGKRRYFDAKMQLNGSWQPWASSLPFTLTQEQQSAISDIATDFSKPVAARRMIVGDVGAGKTMVIMAAAMMARPNRSILMAPTTILANQLFEEAQKFLQGFKIALVTNTSKKEPLEGYDFIIGTHALLYRDLPDAALVMVDEQHRFGTAQRALLEQLVSEGEKRPHYLQFSATPIPRTQAMIDAAHIDVSLITQTPYKKDITTTVIRKEDFPGLLEHIKEELAHERQVLIVYPLVEQSESFGYQSIDEARSYWERNFEKVFVTHGKDKAKEEVLVRFREEGNILLATTVVEVGISLPRLSTVVIVGAERLGLSTLHQLRGRVSRTGLKGYCYLFTHQKTTERIDAFATTDNGFDIAALDLKFRQSGDLLTGKNQSGKKFMWVDMAEDEAIVKEVAGLLQAPVKV